jgi:hypothetical protein
MCYNFRQYPEEPFVSIGVLAERVILRISYARTLAGLDGGSGYECPRAAAVTDE